MAMRKEEILIRVSGHEKATIEALAEQEKLAVGSLVRRMLLLEAERRGITPPDVERTDLVRIEGSETEGVQPQ